MRLPLIIANFCDQLIQPPHELTQSQDRARQTGSHDHFWKQLRVSLGETGAPILRGNPGLYGRSR